MSEIQKHLEMIACGKHLDIPDAGRVFQIIMNGGATPAQIAAVLIGFRINGESVDEITGAAMALRQKAKKIKVPDEIHGRIIDTCGTGGDGKGTYNVSTAVAFVVAGAGVPVAKHGNKAVSSKSGSADVLRALGVNIDMDEELALECLQQAGLCFMMAPRYHSAMRHVAPIRQELGMRTIFNLLGPLINPTSPEKQLLGVYDKRWVEPLAHVLDHLDTKSAWVVHGGDGMDELTIMGESYVTELKDGEVRSFTINPEELGIEIPEDEDALVGGNEIENSQALKNVLAGEEGAYRDIVILNAGAALVVDGLAKDIKEGVKLAADSIDNGNAKATLKKLVEVSNSRL